MKRKALCLLLILITLAFLISPFSISAEQEYEVFNCERSFSYDSSLFRFRLSPMPYGATSIRFYVTVTSAEGSAGFSFFKTPKYVENDVIAFDVSEFQLEQELKRGERLELNVIVDYKLGAARQDSAKSHGIYFYDATGATPKTRNLTPMPLENRTCFSEDGKYFRTEITDLADKFEFYYTVTLRSEDNPDRSVTFSDYPSYVKETTYGFAIPSEMRSVFDYGERLSLTLSALDEMTGDTYFQNPVSGYAYDVPPVVEPPEEPLVDPIVDPTVPPLSFKNAPRWVYLTVFAVCTGAVVIAVVVIVYDRRSGRKKR